MPQYTLLIYVPAEGGPSPEERAAEMPRWFEYTEALRDAGVMVAGEALKSPEAARTVRVRDGERRVAAGPFAATTEVLGGYYVVDVPDIAAAEDWAERIPSAPYGSVEVRPLMVFPETEGEPGAAAQATTSA
jgi:hypothetical protein